MTALEPFGRGLRVERGDLVFDRGDLVETAGLANLVQALTLRILTPLGSDRFNTTYGLDVRQAFTTPSSVRVVKELLKLNLVSTLTADPRVSEVVRVTFDDEEDRLAGNPDGARAARIGRRWTVVVEVGTVAGAPVTLRANVEV